MTTAVKIEHTNGPTREMNISFGDDVEGYRRCIGAAHRDPFAEPEEQTVVRLLGAALIQALDETIKDSEGGVIVPYPKHNEAFRLKERAKDEVETAVMLAVKALYAAKQ